MISVFTETLEKLLINKNYGEVSEDTSLTEVINLMKKFPKFVFNSTAVSFNFDMLDLFIHAYDLREIGAETEEMFLHFWRETTEKLLVKYAPKIQMWLDNFNDLFKFTVKLQKTNTLEREHTKVGSSSDSGTAENTSSSNTTNTYYLNPVNATTTNLKVQDVDKSDLGNTETKEHNNENEYSENINATLELTEEKDVLQSVWGKTRANLLQQILELEDIYLTALYEFDILFMGLY